MLNYRQNNLEEFSKYHVHLDTEIISEKEQKKSDVLLV